MRTIEGTGLLGGTIEALRRLVAASTTFQRIVGAVDAAQAQAFIHSPYADDSQDGDGRMIHARPRAIINPPTSASMVQGGTGSWSDEGNLFLWFEFLPAASASGNRDDELTQFCNDVGAILLEMRDLSAQDYDDEVTYLNAMAFRLTAGPAECDVTKEIELFYGAGFEVTWM